MGLQRIGGAKVYVLTGNTDPQKNAQYWSSMVTSQKYKLWEEAQKAAMADMKLDELNYQQRIDVYNAQKKLLDREQAEVRKRIAGYEKELLTGGPKTTTRITEKPAVTKTTTGGGGSGTKSYRSQAERDIEKLDNSIYQTQSDLNSAEMKANLLSSNDALRKQAEADKAAAENRIETLKKQKRRRSIALGLEPAREGESAETLEQIYGGGEVTTGGDRITTTPGYTTTSKTTSGQALDTTSIQAEIAELQRELANLTREERELEVPELRRKNLLERTREVYRGDILGEDVVTPSATTQVTPEDRVEPPRMTPSRRSELEALAGDDVAFMESLGLEPEYLPPAAIREPVATVAPPLGSDVKQAALEQRSEELARLKAEQLAQDALYTPIKQEPSMVPSYTDIDRSRIELGEPTLPTYTGPQYDAGRMAEMAALGMEDMMAEVQPPAQPQPSVQEVREQIEFVKNPPSFEIPGMEPKEKPKASPEIKYKIERIKASKRLKDSDFSFDDDNMPEYAKIVKSLYIPSMTESEAKRAELIKNAWDEITLTYATDKETMKKAHEYLLFLDREGQGKKTAK